MKTTITLFCHRNSSNAPKPGQPVTDLMLLAAPRTAAPGNPNAGVFSDENGSAHFQVSGATDAFCAQFKAGKQYKLTIEEAE